MNIKEQDVLIQNANCVLRVGLIDSSGEIIFNIRDPKKETEFVVHMQKDGRMYVTFFKHDLVRFNCAVIGIRKICQIFLDDGIIPSINVHYTNKPLIKLMTYVGFNKVKSVKHLYVLSKKRFYRKDKVA